MARTTISQIIDEGFETSQRWFDEIRPRLQKAYDDGKITWGEYCYIYNMCNDYHHERFFELIDRLNKSKNHIPSDIAKMWDWSYYVDQMKKLNEKCFVRLEEVGE